jgi:hypothetical protein
LSNKDKNKILNQKIELKTLRDKLQGLKFSPAIEIAKVPNDLLERNRILTLEAKFLKKKVSTQDGIIESYEEACTALSTNNSRLINRAVNYGSLPKKTFCLALMCAGGIIMIIILRLLEVIL